MLIKIKDLTNYPVLGTQPLSNVAELLGVYINRDGSRYYAEYNTIDQQYEVLLRPYETSDMIQFDVSKGTTYTFDVDTLTVVSESGDFENQFKLSITTDLTDVSLPYGSVIKRAVLNDFVGKMNYLVDGGVVNGYIIKQSIITLNLDPVLITDFVELSHTGDTIQLINRVDFDITDDAVVDPTQDKIIRLDWNDGVSDWRTYYNINIDNTLVDTPEYSNTYGYLLFEDVYVPAFETLNIRSLYNKTSKNDLLSYIDTENIIYFILSVTDIEDLTDSTNIDRNTAYSLWNQGAANQDFTYDDIQNIGKYILQIIKNRIDYLIFNDPVYNTTEYKRLSIYLDYAINEDPSVLFCSDTYLSSEQSEELVETIVDELHNEWLEFAENYVFWQVFSNTYFEYWRKMFIFAYNISVNENRIVYSVDNYTIQASILTMDYLLTQATDLSATFSTNARIMADSLRNMVKKVDSNDWLNSLS